MDAYLYHEIYEMEKNHWWFRGRRAIIEDILKRRLSPMASNALDIGCGTGFNAILLQSYARHVEGLEISDVAIELIRKRNSTLTVTRGAFPRVAPAKTYDLVTLFDVLEHIDEEKEALQKIEALLNPGGIAIITVPAFSFLWSEHDDVHHHQRRYTKKEFTEKIYTHTNLVVEKISYFNFFLALPIAGMRIFKKTFGITAGHSDAFTMPMILNTVLTPIFSFEKFWLRYANFPFGVSLLCIIRKKNI